MKVQDKQTHWCFLLLLAGAVSQTFKPEPSVIYPFITTCAVKGSTVTLPCTFTPATSVTINEIEIQLKIIRVLWCQNHEICQPDVPSVYDSDSPNNDPRYQYLGDKKRNCTLQIRDIQKKDNATFRFRMETNPGVGHFTNRTGVRVSVVDGIQMRIKSSSNNNTFTRGQSVTLQCTTDCTFNQLEVTWFRDGHALSESGPALQLSYLTAKDSGNYTCALMKNTKTRSLQYSLQVEEPEEEIFSTGIKIDNMTVVRLVLFSGHTVLIIIVASIIIRRTCCLKDTSRSAAERHVEVQNPHVTEQL